MLLAFLMSENRHTDSQTMIRSWREGYCRLSFRLSTISTRAAFLRTKAREIK